jgi:hypothetical protein
MLPAVPSQSTPAPGPFPTGQPEYQDMGFDRIFADPNRKVTDFSFTARSPAIERSSG